MKKHVFSAAKWASALCGLLLSPVVLGALVFAAYFVVDGARTLGRPGTLALLGIVLGATLLFRRRGADPQG